MTLFYKKCQKNGYETSYSPETEPNFNFKVEKNYTFLRISPLLVMLQKRTVSQIKALNKLIIHYFVKKSI